MNTPVIHIRHADKTAYIALLEAEVARLNREVRKLRRMLPPETPAPGNDRAGVDAMARIIAGVSGRAEEDIRAGRVGKGKKRERDYLREPLAKMWVGLWHEVTGSRSGTATALLFKMDRTTLKSREKAWKETVKSAEERMIEAVVLQLWGEYLETGIPPTVLPLQGLKKPTYGY